MRPIEATRRVTRSIRAIMLEQKLWNGLSIVNAPVGGLTPLIAAGSNGRRVYGRCVRHQRSTFRFGSPRVSQMGSVMAEQELCDGLPFKGVVLRWSLFLSLLCSYGVSRGPVNEHLGSYQHIA